MKTLIEQKAEIKKDIKECERLAEVCRINLKNTESAKCQLQDKLMKINASMTEGEVTEIKHVYHIQFSNTGHRFEPQVWNDLDELKDHNKIQDSGLNYVGKEMITGTIPREHRPAIRFIIKKVVLR